MAESQVRKILGHWVTSQERDNQIYLPWNVNINKKKTLYCIWAITPFRVHLLLQTTKTKTNIGTFQGGSVTICYMGLAARRPAVSQRLRASWNPEPTVFRSKRLLKQLPATLGRGSYDDWTCSSGAMNGKSQNSSLFEMFAAEKYYKKALNSGRSFHAEIEGTGESPEIKCLRGLKSLLLLNPKNEDERPKVVFSNKGLSRPHN